MQLGAVLPQTELGGDAGALRAWASGVEDLGYAHVLAYDHVLGADPVVHEGWSGPYDIDTTFHEPLVLYGFLAGKGPQYAVDCGCAHGALAMTTPGDTSTATLAEVERLIKGGSARIAR